MSILSRLRAAFGRPPQQRGCAVTNGFFELHPLADPDWPSRAPAAYAREGYAQNPVAMRSIAMIAQCVAAVPLRLRHGARELSDHPLLRLLQRPNPLQSGPQLIEALISHMQIHGDGWLKVTLIDGEPAELVTLRPDKVRIITDEAGWPRAWEYRAGERAIRFAQSADDPVAPLFQLRTFSPLSDIHGLSPFSAAARAVDIHNAAARWSKALLDNAARPSGALVYRGEGGAGLSHEQFERLKTELESAYAGAANAGRPMVLEGGLEWTPLSHSPKDMEHIELRHAAARDIALAFGVPPMLLGIPGDNTYANYAEANRAFWRQTVIPLARRLAAGLTNWLAPAYDGALRLAADTDAIAALSGQRAALFKRMQEADFLTINEKRAALGYPPIDGGDELGRGAE